MHIIWLSSLVYTVSAASVPYSYIADSPPEIPAVPSEPQDLIATKSLGYASNPPPLVVSKPEPFPPNPDTSVFSEPSPPIQNTPVIVTKIIEFIVPSSSNIPGQPEAIEYPSTNYVANPPPGITTVIPTPPTPSTLLPEIPLPELPSLTISSPMIPIPPESIANSISTVLIEFIPSKIMPAVPEPILAESSLSTQASECTTSETAWEEPSKSILEFTSTPVSTYTFVPYIPLIPAEPTPEITSQPQVNEATSVIEEIIQQQDLDEEDIESLDVLIEESTAITPSEPLTSEAVILGTETVSVSDFTLDIIPAIDEAETTCYEVTYGVVTPEPINTIIPAVPEPVPEPAPMITSAPENPVTVFVTSTITFTETVTVPAKYETPPPQTLTCPMPTDITVTETIIWNIPLPVLEPGPVIESPSVPTAYPNPPTISSPISSETTPCSTSSVVWDFVYPHKQ